ncbi:MAG TPA: hypothetical protein VK671_13565 [Mucilaginibacter sp.]|jgi:hypothetical protein|nr:hypothetical protein [Mucilaginibacter sp.]
MNKKLLLEFIPLTLFVIFGILTFFRIPYMGLIALLSGMLLAMLYFYAAFWLFAETVASIASRIITGLALSITIIACIFSLQRWPYWKMYGIISYSALGIMLIICLFNFRSTAYKPLLYRCILFLVLLSLIYGYRSFPA